MKEPINVYLGDKRSGKATKIGNVVSFFEQFGKLNRVDIKNVYYSKDMSSNLISYGKITDNSTIISKGNELRILYEFGNLTTIVYKENNIYPMKSFLKNEHLSNNTEISVNKMSEKEKYHRILGHVNFIYLNTLCKHQLVTGLPKEIENEFIKFQICLENKMHNLQFQNNRVKAKEVLEIIHSDICGPFITTGLNGERYFVSFIDDYSKLSETYCIKTQD